MKRIKLIIIYSAFIFTSVLMYVILFDQKYHIWYNSLSPFLQSIMFYVELFIFIGVILICIISDKYLSKSLNDDCSIISIYTYKIVENSYEKVISHIDKYLYEKDFSLSKERYNGNLLLYTRTRFGITDYIMLTHIEKDNNNNNMKKIFNIKNLREKHNRCNIRIYDVDIPKDDFISFMHHNPVSYLVGSKYSMYIPKYANIIIDLKQRKVYFSKVKKIWLDNSLVDKLFFSKIVAAFGLEFEEKKEVELIKEV